MHVLGMKTKSLSATRGGGAVSENHRRLQMLLQCVIAGNNQPPVSPVCGPLLCLPHTFIMSYHLIPAGEILYITRDQNFPWNDGPLVKLIKEKKSIKRAGSYYNIISLYLHEICRMYREFIAQ